MWLACWAWRQDASGDKDVAKLKKMADAFKADIVKQIWKELPKHMEGPVAPLDEDMLADLAKEPAVGEGDWAADGFVVVEN
eukprot:Skav233800  [mRNA]  locus=scaffold780:531898:533168:- [translate_table: standard]